MARSTKYARYTGKSGKTGTYKVLWSGKTKSGKMMAKLGFIDGSSEFWVDLNAIQECEEPTNSRSSRRANREDEECDLCSENKYTCGHCIGW
jgi:hypothetical protein